MLSGIGLRQFPLATHQLTVSASDGRCCNRDTSRRTIDDRCAAGQKDNNSGTGDCHADNHPDFRGIEYSRLYISVRIMTCRVEY